MTIANSTLAHLDVSRFAGVPSALTECRRWCVWKYEVRDGKPTKVPYSPATGYGAKSNDAQTWCDYQIALDAYAAGGWDGLGFFLGDGFAGVDLDHSLDESGGGLKPWARTLAERVTSYAEISPSRLGVKIIAYANGEGGTRRARTGGEPGEATELYYTGRFFTITGDHFDGWPQTVERCDESLRTIFAELTAERNKRRERAQKTAPPSSPHPAPSSSTSFGLSDEELIERACRARNGDAFSRLWSGDTSGHGDDASSADLALCNHLAFWTRGDAAQMDRLFRASSLMRAKWGEKHSADGRTYGQMTIDTALIDTTNVYQRRPALLPPPSHIRPPTVQEIAAAPYAARRIIGDEVAILNKKDPLPTARLFLDDQYRHAERWKLLMSGDSLYAWGGSAYLEKEPSALRHELYPWLECHMRAVKGPDGHLSAEPFQPTKADVDGTIDALRALIYTPTRAPAWLADNPALPNPTHLIVAANGICDLSSPAAPALLARTPLLFATNAIVYDYNPAAPEPAEWLRFLDSLWPDDPESIELLQEWFGYVATADTSQQKILMLLGPPRSGKGTVARVLTQMIGKANVCAPTLSGLASNFGLSSVVGKQLAIIGDARLGPRADQAVITERLLTISGGDAIDIDRKNREILTTTLNARFMIVTNELPRLIDASGALPSRFLILTLETSHLGREDKTIEGRVLRELPGILNWAISGWRRLHERGNFHQPGAGQEAIEEMRDLASPVSIFLREMCELTPAATVEVQELFNAWGVWCEAQGRKNVGSATTLGRDLRAVLPSLSMSSNRVPAEPGTRVRAYRGLRLTLAGAAAASQFRAKREHQGQRAPRFPGPEEAFSFSGT